MLVHHTVTPSTEFTGTHLYSRAERDTVRAMCLAQEHNLMSLAGSWASAAASGVKHTDHEAALPLHDHKLTWNKTTVKFVVFQLWQKLTNLSFACLIRDSAGALPREFTTLFNISTRHLMSCKISWSFSENRKEK